MIRELLFSLMCGLLPNVHGAQGLVCAFSKLSESRSFTKNCTQNESMVCITLTEENTFGNGVSPNGTYKDCIAEHFCRPLAFTLTTLEGKSRRQIQSNMACCSNNGCNENLILNVPPVDLFDNGVQCPSCEKLNSRQCEGQLYIACQGIEKKCISLVGLSTDNANQNFSIRGCATENACKLKQNDSVAFRSDIYQLSVDAVCTNRGILGTIYSPATIFFHAVGAFLLHVLP